MSVLRFKEGAIALMKYFLIVSAFLLNSFCQRVLGADRPTRTHHTKTCQLSIALFDDPDYFSRDPMAKLRRDHASRQRQSTHRASHVSSADGDFEMSNGGHGHAAREEEIYFK